MRTVRLPKHLDQLDLADLNKNLRAGEIYLDWSDVASSLSSEQMAILLSGLQLTAHSEFLGIGTIPPSLQDRIYDILLDQEMEQMRQQVEKMEHPGGADPSLWLPEGERPDGDATMIKQYLAQQNIGELVLPVDIVSKSAPLPKPHSTAPFGSASVSPGMNTVSTQKKVPAISALSTLVLDMQELAMADITHLLAQLQPLLNAYKAWIDEQNVRLQKQTDSLQNREKDLQTILHHCRKALAGIHAGLTLLKDNKEALQAFCFMNQAMWLQRVHTLYAAQKPYHSHLLPGDVDLPKNRRWQPFQLAFILLNLSTLTTSPGEWHDEKQETYADRLWFPSGDGKAEARLALAAYALGLHRLQGSEKAAEERQVVVLRYRPPLFPSQQFQQIAALTCACEMIRHANRAIWGNIPFRLGLWTTPQSAENGQIAHQSELHPAAGDSASMNMARLLPTCLWCGSPVVQGRNIEVESYSSGRKRVRRTVLYCGDPAEQCSFSRKRAYSEGLPVLVADEGLDRLLPSLLVAPIDKSVHLPWNAITQILFV